MTEKVNFKYFQRIFRFNEFAKIVELVFSDINELNRSDFRHMPVSTSLQNARNFELHGPCHFSQLIEI